ncbi:Rne/Rng family ribonuclease [Phenylobacterium sp. LH3H17]|uniref:ribonuclease E/G n=1 Tax=Phenylobacterium sp. LH3H17 TaxID=2903901 RepID=UPI0020C9EF55|nr:ribonuclease E/G [Phenylobacterium sp. LH3H17]UTP41503.1 Rne/Rng family ribonuclease [Phenylobacterium sp. LH3H17]
MPKKMLIDAAHAEETRVVVIDGTRVEEFDFESQNRKQLRGNIYLAKVTRVEPSLQAAFIEYGGNRHGFLAFNEIHPDYYQIPVADREALMREEAEEEDDHPEPRGRSSSNDDEDDDDAVEDDDDVMEEEVARRRRRLMRKYKIQEVIRRRQIMLVQVVKEERGNKGAALTTYLSLAGRYGVLMPNTARGGGISRKITTVTDRKRLKGVVQSLDVPDGMGLIVRTAGAKRTKAEIKRDYEYLLRLWENIRETTLHSVAPALIYEEEDLVKRTIRDLYDKDIDEVWVEGEAGFKEAREFMRMLMPSQAKKVQPYREPMPLFVKYRIEDHLSQIYSPVVPLKSGGYLVINQTEALVAVDVNSGRATRERNIEATALKTNMEAAEEAARQLRLRDLAGLIVIDFIDMDESKNNRAVEKKLKDSLKDDRARVQMGKISSFGLMEISRQRRRSGVLEGTTHVCEHCGGAGRVRTVESSALTALRALEIEALKGGGEATLKVPRAVGLYILNEKRNHLARVHESLGLFITIVIDDALAHADHEIERTSSETRPEHQALISRAPIQAYQPVDEDLADETYEDEDEDEEGFEDEEAVDREATDDDEAEHRLQDSEEGDDDRGQRRGRRRRRRGRRDGEPREATDRPAAAAVPAAAEAAGSDTEDDGQGGRRRRRGRRGGRRMRDDGRPTDVFSWTRPWVPYGDDPFVWHDPAEDIPAPRAPVAANDERPAPVAQAQPVISGPDVDVWVELPAVDDKPKKTRSRRGRGRGRGEDGESPAESAVEAEAPMAEAPSVEAVVEPVIEAAPEPEPAVEAAPVKKPRARRTKASIAAEAAAAEAVAETAPEAAPEPEPEPAPTPAPPVVAVREPDPAEIGAKPPAAARKGWWRRG